MNTLEKSREATDMANIRAAYAEAMVGFLDTETTSFPIYVKSQKMVQAQEDWQHIDWPAYLGSKLAVKAGQEPAVQIADNGTVTVTLSPSGTDVGGQS